MVLGRELAHDAHIHKLVIISDSEGWEVRVLVHRRQQHACRL